MKITTKKITEADLSYFSGSMTKYRASLSHLVYTDGIHYLVEHGAAWLVDVITSHQPSLAKNFRLQEFQVWNLNLDGNGGCVVSCQEDSGMPMVVEQKIPYTDFPFDIKIYVENGMILLPSEH